MEYLWGKSSSRYDQDTDRRDRTSYRKQVSDLATPIEPTPHAKTLNQFDELQLECEAIARNIATLPQKLQMHFQDVTMNNVPSSQEKVLEQRLQKAEEHIEHQRHVIQRLEREVALARTDVSKYKDETTALRNVILEDAGESKINDDSISSHYHSLNQEIHGLIYSKAIDIGQLRAIPDKIPALPAQVTAFYSELMPLSNQNRSLYAKATIFLWLYDQVLDSLYFGTRGPEDNSSDPESMATLESYLGHFERSLYDKNVSATAIVDWRISTINALDAAGMHYDCGTALARQIYSWLTPLLAVNVQKSDFEEFKSSLLEICKSAYSLRLLMRSSKEDYQCMLIPLGDSPDQHQETATVFNKIKVERGSSEIAFNIFGALIKFPHYRGYGRVVLEKAQVFVKKRE